MTTINFTQVLDIETMQFEAGPTMEGARFAATRLDADRVLVIGGYDNSNDDETNLASTEILGAVDK